jgi:hypothetical protein
MKSIEELKKFFDTELQSDLELLDAQRKKIVTQIVILEILLFAVYAASLYMCWYFDLSYGFHILFTISYAAFAWMIVKSYRGNEQFYKDFKNLVIERMINQVDKSLHYNAYKKISLNDFKYSSLFSGTFKRYYGDDFVWGQIDGMQIQFCELDVASGKGYNAKLDYVFHGLFLVAETNMQIPSEIIVIPKANANLKTINKTLPVVHVNHNQFESVFQIRSNDEKAVKSIFTDSFLTQMYDFSQRSKHNLYFSFHGNRAYFGVELKRKLFEPKIFQTLKDFSIISEYFHDLYSAINIVEQLRLKDAELQKT